MFKLKENDVILFQGDSITDGARGRNSDLNHVMGHGYQYILAGEMLADNPGKGIQVYNRGISGNRVSDLYGRWQEDCLMLKPTVLSILIGINDIAFKYINGSGSDPDRLEKIYGQLLDEVLEQNPDTFLVIMEPFFGVNPDPDINAHYLARIDAMRQSVKNVAEKYNAVFVPLQDVFDDFASKYDIFEATWDGIHPTVLGHQLIANRWKECVLEKLNDR
ncbi:MAG: SGNH/GDSL hydrolase family protein [Clostridia bacterium]|nr:SGNH/GDSL hydrolase family protein [Clostridia bacterium]